MAFACENVGRDPAGPVSFQNVMDGIGAVDFPAMTGRWFAIFCFFSEVETTITNCRVVITNESGELIAQQKLNDLKFSAENQTSRNVIAFAGLAWPTPGRYKVTFMAHDADVLAFFPMLVQQTPEPSEEPGPEEQT
jgi:hypothetical protein